MNDYTSKPLARLTAQQQSVLLRFRAIQERLLAGYEKAAAEALINMQDADPLVAHMARVRLDWNTQAAEELRGRM